MENPEYFEKISRSLNSSFENSEMKQGEELEKNLTEADTQPITEGDKRTNVKEHKTTDKKPVQNPDGPKRPQTEEPIEAETTELTVQERRELQAKQNVQKDDVMEDQKYIQNELYMSISNVTEVMTKLRDGIKEGDKPSAFEAYARLNDSLNNTLEKLADLNLKISDKQAFQDLPKENDKANQTIIFNGAGMLDEILKLKQQMKDN